MVESFSRVESVAQFNKLNKGFITALSGTTDKSLLNHDFYLYVDILFDESKETVVGTYDNFQIVRTDSLPRQVHEDELNTVARTKIVEKYPLELQLSIIGQLLETLADTANVDSTDLKDMNDYIAEVKRVNKLRKEFFAANTEYQYLSTGDREAIFAKQMEGGIAQFSPTASNL